MSKYNALRDYLRRQSASHLKMGFEEIESILEEKLPASAKKYPEWWGNEDQDKTSHVQCLSWQSAGYNAVPDIEAEQVVFEKNQSN